MGRPSSYTEEIADLICGRLAQGESLLGICRSSGVPHYVTVYRWIDEKEDFRNKYARARDIQGHSRAEMAVEAAIGAEDAGLGRLAFDALKWHASKLAPKVYGDKSEVVMSGPNGGPVQTETKLSAMDPIEAMRAYQRMMGEDKP